METLGNVLAGDLFEIVFLTESRTRASFINEDQVFIYPMYKK
jgi:hypothetical protein